MAPSAARSGALGCCVVLRGLLTSHPFVALRHPPLACSFAATHCLVLLAGSCAVSRLHAPSVNDAFQPAFSSFAAPPRLQTSCGCPVAVYCVPTCGHSFAALLHRRSVCGSSASLMRKHPTCSISPAFSCIPPACSSRVALLGGTTRLPHLCSSYKPATPV